MFSAVVPGTDALMPWILGAWVGGGWGVGPFSTVCNEGWIGLGSGEFGGQVKSWGYLSCFLEPFLNDSFGLEGHIIVLGGVLSLRVVLT